MPQAFKQAPWRLQIRATSRTALWIVGLLVLGGLYLAVNAKVAGAGRELMVLEREQELLARANAELNATYAGLTAPELMMARAAYFGFRPVKPEEVEYIRVEGALSDPSFVAPRPPRSESNRFGMLSPSYTETLGERLVAFLQGLGE
jgi:hypothetical protein